MIADLNPYPEYRSAEGQWLGKVPAHWAVRRFKYILREKDSRSVGGKEQLLRVSQFTGVTQRLNVNGLAEPDTRAASLVGYKCVNPDDLVINIMLAWNGSLGVSRYDGIASPAYCVYHFDEVAMPWYYHHLLRSPAYKARIKALSTGVVESRLRLYTDDLFRLEALLPPPEEQAAIVRFLNHTNQRIDRTIRAKRKVIALLNEQKQVIIHRAVTRGLDPNVRLKTSGIPWLGEIPENWETIRCGHLFQEINDIGHSDLRLLSIDRIKGIIPQSDTGRRERASKDRSKYKRVQCGQLAYNLMNAFMGSIAISNYDGIVSPAYATAKPTRPINGHYFHYLLKTNLYTGEYSRRSYGIMYERNRLYFERFKLVMAIVPPLHEQENIVAWIEENTASLTVTITRIEREIDLLHEYRTRLVADVVTGKLDVREATSQLPEIDEFPDLDTDITENDSLIEDEE